MGSDSNCQQMGSDPISAFLREPPDGHRAEQHGVAEHGGDGHLQRFELVFGDAGEVHGERAYFFDGGHRIRALDLETSAQWTYPPPDQNGAPLDALTAALSVDSDHVIVPTRTRVLCLSANGQLLWNVKIDDDEPITTQGTIFKNTYICGTGNGRILCLDLASGTVLWSYKTQERPPRGFFSRPTIHEGHVYLGSESGGLYCIAVE